MLITFIKIVIRVMKIDASNSKINATLSISILIIVR